VGQVGADEGRENTAGKYIAYRRILFLGRSNFDCGKAEVLAEASIDPGAVGAVA
jgi:hypothetical protein